MPGATLKIEGARFLITMDASRRIIQDGFCRDRGATYHPRRERLLSCTGVPADQVIDAREMVVTPGFCNNHMHISYAHAVRGIFPDDLNPAVYLANVFSCRGP